MLNAGDLARCVDPGEGNHITKGNLYRITQAWKSSSGYEWVKIEPLSSSDKDCLRHHGATFARRFEKL